MGKPTHMTLLYWSNNVTIIAPIRGPLMMFGHTTPLLLIPVIASGCGSLMCVNVDWIDRTMQYITANNTMQYITANNTVQYFGLGPSLE